MKSLSWDDLCGSNKVAIRVGWVIGHLVDRSTFTFQLGHVEAQKDQEHFKELYTFYKVYF